jgi:hypothetical protein
MASDGWAPGDFVGLRGKYRDSSAALRFARNDTFGIDAFPSMREQKQIPFGNDNKKSNGKS